MDAPKHILPGLTRAAALAAARRGRRRFLRNRAAARLARRLSGGR